MEEIKRYKTRFDPITLCTIARGECADYNTLYGGGEFSGDAFPGINPATGSSAAGRYQFIQRTWDHVSGILGLKDFSPINQDLAAVYLLKTHGVLNALMQGNFDGAVHKAAGTWASFPMPSGTSRYFGNSAVPLSKLWETYASSLVKYTVGTGGLTL